MKDRRRKRKWVKEDQRVKPYIYPYELSDAAVALGIPIKRLQTFILENHETLIDDE